MEQLKEYFDRKTMNPKVLNHKEKYCPIKSLKNLKEMPLRVHKMDGGAYEVLYFNKNGIFRSIQSDDVVIKNSMVAITCEDNTFIYEYNGYNTVPKIPSKIGDVLIHTYYFQMTLSTLAVAISTIDDFIERYNWLIDHKHLYPKELYDEFFLYTERQKAIIYTDIQLDRLDAGHLRDFILKIEEPVFERESENKKEKTFDFIRVALSVPSKEICPIRSDIIKKFQKELIDIAVSTIEKSWRFQKFGVPVNILRLTKMKLSSDSQLHFLFELKEIRG